MMMQNSIIFAISDLAKVATSGAPAGLLQAKEIV